MVIRTCDRCGKEIGIAETYFKLNKEMYQNGVKTAFISFSLMKPEKDYCEKCMKFICSYLGIEHNTKEGE